MHASMIFLASSLPFTSSITVSLCSSCLYTEKKWLISSKMCFGSSEMSV